MRILVAVATVLAVLSARSTVNAAVDKEAGSHRPTIERCLEVPISLAFDVVEREASRSLRADSLMSDGRTVVATPAPPHVEAPAPDAPRPFSPVPRACQSPDDPRCHVTAPPPAPHQIHLEHAGHAIALSSSRWFVPPVAPDEQLEIFVPEGGPHDAHPRGVFRPPRSSAALIWA